MKPDIEPRLLGVNTTATYLGIHRSSVYRLIESGELPHVQIGGRRLIERTDLDAYIDARKTVAR